MAQHHSVINSFSTTNYLVLSTHFIKQHFLTFSFTLAIISSYFVSFSPWLDTSAYDDQRLIQLLFLLLSGSYILARVLQTKKIPSTLLSTTGMWLSLFFGLGILSSSLAFSPRMGFFELAIFLLLFLSSLYIADEISNSPQQPIESVLKLCGFGCLLYTFKLSVVYISIFLVGVQPNPGDFILGFSNYRFFNHTQTISLPLLVLLYLNDTENGKKKYKWLLLIGYWWALLILLTGRGTFIGLMAGCTVAYWLRKSRATSFCKAMLISGLLGLAMYLVFFVAIPANAGFESFGLLSNLEKRTLDNPTSGRLLLWQWALELIAENPWLGTGPMHYAHNAGDLRIFSHPHNWVLQIAAEWGVPALLCLCIAIYSSLRSLVKTAANISIDDYRNQTVLTAWIVIGVAILVDGLFSGLIVMPLSQCLIFLYLGCVTGWEKSFKADNVSSNKASTRFMRFIFSGLLLSSMCVIFMILWTGIMKFEYDENKPLTVNKPQAIAINYPRLWQQGRF